MKMIMNSLFFLLVIIGGSVWAYEQIAPGVRYIHLNVNTPLKQSIHLLSLDPSLVRLDIGLAHDQCEASETVSHLAGRHSAIAAINGGFFDFGCLSRFDYFVTVLLDLFGVHTYNAYPVYGLKMNQAWISTSLVHTGVCGWSSDMSHIVFDTIKTDCVVSIGSKKYSITDINKACLQGIMLYTSHYGATTPSAKQVTEIIIEHDQVQCVISGSSGRTKIPVGGVVLVFSGDNHDTREIVPGALITFSYVSTSVDGVDTSSQWNQMEQLLASTPLLIKDGVVVSTLAQRSSEFYRHRHPRTAIGVVDSGAVVLAVVDGRSRNARGFTILELANFMKQLGCIHALNLDGGGSSTMVIRDTIVNRPSGRRGGFVRNERPISTALIVVPKDHGRVITPI